jgi:glycine/D-amino acid oxidase-like deaminating enzyme
VTIEEIFAGIRESIANARPDVRREQAMLLEHLEQAVDQRAVEKTMALLERLDLNDHYPAARQPDGTLQPQPMPGGWTSWYGWMAALKAWEEAPYRAERAATATSTIPERQIFKTPW